MNRFIKKCVYPYLGIWGVYGAYRGWNADYEYHRYNSPMEKKIRVIPFQLQTQKYLTKGMRCWFNGVWYVSIGHVCAVYRTMCRIEIWVCKKNPYEHIFAYEECFGDITLPPSQDER